MPDPIPPCTRTSHPDCLAAPPDVMFHRDSEPCRCVCCNEHHEEVPPETFGEAEPYELEAGDG